MEFTQGWNVNTSIAGSYRLFGYATIDNIIWSILFVYFIVVFYEVFLDKHVKNSKLYYPHLKYLIIFSLIVFLTFIYLYFNNPSILRIQHFYFKVGLIVGPAPIIFMLLKSPKIYSRFLKLIMFFFFLSFAHEISSLALNQWSFPDSNQFIGMIKLGTLSFPVEEFIFWMFLSSAALISYYEFYDDDEK